MHAHKLRVTIPNDHRLEIAVDLPDDFPSGPAEVIVLAGKDHGAESALTVLEELRSLRRTAEEERALDDFDAFRREHGVRLASLDTSLDVGIDRE